MPILLTALNTFLWPGNRYCARMGDSPSEDSGMLLGFINSVVWGSVLGIVLVIALWNVM